jgi:hypothetical protein
MMGPSSHAGGDHQTPRGDTKADRDAARDAGDGTACDLTEGHPEGDGGHDDEAFNVL